ncbi:6-carboxytetrahydropterin synthase QueD [Mycobacterium marinum]|uniref:6-carboxytetrahydropterin synthase QueD n=1 Tax=Mycobacterium marinum TaxID=1781 RepID=UPI003FEFD6EC
MTDTAEIYCEFTFESAHRLPNVPAGHKCGRLHGHSYRARIYVEGPVDPRAGWIVDFGKIKDACKPVIARLDHYYLNEIDGLENPTSEQLSMWIWRELATLLPMMSAVSVSETCSSGCMYRGPRVSASESDVEYPSMRRRPEAVGEQVGVSGLRQPISSR